MSRLEENSRILRENLISRNEYSENRIYDINNPVSIQFINELSSLLRPGNGFDFSNTVIGRIVGPQTPISVIGNRALINHYTEQVKSTIVRKNIPTINLGNLFTGKDVELSTIDYSITKENPDTLEERLLNVLKENSGISNINNPIVDTSNNTTEFSKLLIDQYTGKGQLDNLSKLLSNNIYFNNFTNSIEVDNSSIVESKIQDYSSNNGFNFSNFIVGFNGLTISSSLQDYYNRRYSNSQYGSVVTDIGLTYKTNIVSNSQDSEDIVSINKSEDTFTWGKSDNNINNDIGILGYTNALFNSLSTDGKPSKYSKTVDSIEVDGKRYYNGVKYAGRSYSTSNQMDGIDKTIRPYGNKLKNSTISDRVTPKILYNGDDTSPRNNSMFTIENLAFQSGANGNVELSDVGQLGPNNGRIMWFSPSILDFNEAIQPNINSENFLGRGEPVYTYANTERKLTINFWLMTDYAKEFIDVNTLSEFSNRIYNTESIQVNNNTNSARTNIDGNILKLKEDLVNANLNFLTETLTFDVSDNLPIYFYYNNGSFSMSNLDISLNFDNKLNNLFSKIDQYYTINNSSKFDITIKGSVYDTNDDLKQLYDNRTSVFKNYIEEFYNQNFPKLKDVINITIEPYIDSGTPTGDNSSFNSISSIKKRYLSISDVTISNDSETFETDRSDIPENTTDNILVEGDTLDEITVTASRLDSITINDDEIRDNSILGTFNKIRNNKHQNGLTTYTAKDIYDRLTFLNQCTRQGASPISDNNISNTAFGRPPIIIIKIGDMYNTKAIITQLDFQFEEETPWDLNPEGFGVQKMGCKVSMSMNLIGGSSIEGPKSHILNGYSRRFYANSSFENESDIIDPEERILEN